ncbi:MAG: methylcobamide:CoM methyltransferase [Candidatus Syntrophoarchaeum sp. GoM_oil]|nr:MAG: methylcobamide:CoM methyltransferase [Candidatus Syntrophoarchaeum sp. GoM_oil]
MAQEMNPKERFYAALDRNPVDRIPITGVTQTGITDLMDVCGAEWPEAHSDPEKMAKLAWAAHEIGGLESVRIPFDVYTEAEAAGTELYKWKRGIQPMIKKALITKKEDLDKLQIIDPHKDGRLPQVMKAAEILSKKCEKDNLPLIAHVGAPFGAVMVGYSDMQFIMMFMIQEPDAFKPLVDTALDISVAYAEAFIDAGVDTIFFNEAPAFAISPKQYEEFALPKTQEAIKKIKKLGARVVYHICGDTRNKLHLMAKTGADGISIGQEVPMAEAREMFGENITICGNVNPIFTLIKKGPEEVMAESKQCIDDGTDVLCPGCGWGPNTPLENMKALVAAGKKYGKNARLARQ